MLTRFLRRTLPLVTAVVATLVVHYQDLPAWPFLVLVGLVGAVVAAHSGVSQPVPAAPLVVDDGKLKVLLLGQKLPVSPGTRKVRITLPLASHTRGLSRLLCSIPASTRVELAISSFWPVYLRGESWKLNLVTLEQHLHRHFRSITIVATVWQSPFVTVDGGDEAVGIVVPLDAAGKEAVYLDLAEAPAVRKGLRRMVDMIFARSEAIRIAEQEPPADCDPRTGFEVTP